VLCQNTGNTVTSAQVHAVAKIGAVWKRCGYVARAAKWHGHRCVSAKSCPGDKGWAQLKEVARLTEHYYINGLIAQEDDLVTTQAEFNTFAAKFFDDAGVAYFNYLAADKAAVVAGKPRPAAPARGSMARAGLIISILPWRQQLAANNPVTKTTHPHMHTVMNRLDWLARMFGAAGPPPNTLLDLLKAADDSSDVAAVLAEVVADDSNDIDLSPEDMDLLATKIAARVPRVDVDIINPELPSVDEPVPPPT
jgi:hypothetical protein